MEMLKIPAERVAVLIGERAEVKKRLEELTKTKIEVNEDGEVTISGESYEEFFLKDVITAIGRGFNPKDAEKLLKDEFMLDIINLREVVNGENNLRRIRGRIIGEGGKMKSEIEAATECKISVYGWTVGIIAPIDTMQYAKKAINKIIDGSQLTTIFNDLARYKQEIMVNRLMGR